MVLEHSFHSATSFNKTGWNSNINMQALNMAARKERSGAWSGLVVLNILKASNGELKNIFWHEEGLEILSRSCVRKDFLYCSIKEFSYCILLHEKC